MHECTLCKKVIPSGEGVRHPNDRHYVVHKACGIQKHGNKVIDEWVHCWQMKQIKKDRRWLQHVGLMCYLGEAINDHKLRAKVCLYCGLGIEMDTPWEHKQITRHPAVILGKGKSVFLFYADSTAKWVQIPRKLVAR